MESPHAHKDEHLFSERLTKLTRNPNVVIQASENTSPPQFPFPPFPYRNDREITSQLPSPLSTCLCKWDQHLTALENDRRGPLHTRQHDRLHGPRLGQPQGLPAISDPRPHVCWGAWAWLHPGGLSSVSALRHSSMHWGPVFITNTSPRLYKASHFFQVLPHLSAKTGHVASTAPVLLMGQAKEGKGLVALPATEEEGTPTPTCHPSHNWFMDMQGTGTPYAPPGRAALGIGRCVGTETGGR